MKQRVLIIVENMSAPADVRVWNEAIALRDGGYEVTVLCPRSKGTTRGCEVMEGIRVYRHPKLRQGGSAAGYLWEYGCALFWQFLYAGWIYARHGFDVIQGCSPPDDIFLVALPFKLFGVRYIFDHHDASPELFVSKFDKRGILHRVLVWLERRSFRASDAVLASNGSYRDLAIGRGKAAKEDVFVVRNGPDTEVFKSVLANPELKHGKPHLVGYVGAMDVQDGLDILVDVASRVKEMGRNDVHFTCVGKGPQLPRLRGMVREKHLEDTVKFTGFVPDNELLEILSTADICVNPDKPCEMNSISTMIKIMEYMALGKPIVQFDSKEGRVSAEEASLYCDPAEPVSDFAKKILWLVDHPDERKRMGEFGRNRVETELAWKYSVPNLLAAYKRAFNHNERGGNRSQGG